MTTRPRRITLNSIAEETGTSISTVSRALNNHESIDPATRARVRQAAERLGYKAPGTDERRGQNRVMSVLLNWSDQNALVPSPTSRYGSFNHIQNMLISVEQTAEANGYHLIINSIKGLSNGVPSSIRTQFAGGALILGGLVEDGLVEQIAQAVPTIFVSSFLPSGKVHALHINYRLSTASAVDHLVALGHRRIAFLNGPGSTNTSTEKLAGYLESCWNHDLPLERSLVVAANGFLFRDGIEAAARLFQQAEFTALVAGTDMLARGAIQAAEGRELRVPRDLSVASAYNTEEDQARPGLLPLTGVQVPYQLIGRLAVERLLEIMRRPLPPSATVLYPELKIGSSTAPVREA